MAVVKKISSVKDLNEIRDSVGLDAKKEQINVCIGGGCIASGSLDVKAAFEKLHAFFFFIGLHFSVNNSNFILW